MTKQERNKVFLDAYEELLQTEDGKLIACLARSPQGKTLIVMDFDNDPDEVLEALKGFTETFAKMWKGEIKPEDGEPYR